MRILITGGAGFIGSHVSRRLVGRGDEVVVLDDLSTGSMANVQELNQHRRFELVVGSATDPALVNRLLDQVDVTVHLAAAVGVRLIVERPVHTIETNVEATRIVLEASARAGKPVLITSSSEVYGKNERVPFREDDDLRLGATTHSRWAYACSKALDEWLALAYHNERGLPVVVMRLFNTVGPLQTGRYGMVLPNFVNQALRGEPITVFGSGEQSRCFVDVDDVVVAIERLMATPEAVGEVFNVGSDHEITIEALARRVKLLANSDSPIVRVPYSEAYIKGFEDMQRRVPDLTKLERVTGFRASTPLDETILRVADHWKTQAECSAREG